MENYLLMTEEQRELVTTLRGILKTIFGMRG